MFIFVQQKHTLTFWPEVWHLNMHQKELSFKSFFLIMLKLNLLKIFISELSNSPLFLCQATLKLAWRQWESNGRHMVIGHIRSLGFSWKNVFGCLEENFLAKLPFGIRRNYISGHKKRWNNMMPTGITLASITTTTILMFDSV